MTEQPGYDPAEDPDADPDQLNPRTGDAAGRDDQGRDASNDQDADPDADPDFMNPRTGGHAHPER